MAVKEQELLTAHDEVKAAQDAERKVGVALTQAVKDHSLVLANTDTEIWLLREQITEAKTHELEAVKEYRKSMDFVSRLANQYNGGWTAAMRCAKHAIPDMDWSRVEEAHSRRDFELPTEGEDLNYGVTEADIVNADPQVEFEDVPDQEAAITVNTAEVPMIVADDPVTDKPQELAVSILLVCSFFCCFFLFVVLPPVADCLVQLGQ